jgi:hypothetical protein
VNYSFFQIFKDNIKPGRSWLYLAENFFIFWGWFTPTSSLAASTLGSIGKVTVKVVPLPRAISCASDMERVNYV